MLIFLPKYFPPFLIHGKSLNLESYHVYETLNTLFIGYFNIHPYILYTALILNVVYFNQFFTFQIYNKNIVALFCFALLTGAYWGVSNSVWGYV